MADATPNTPSEYVKLISADGFEFVIHREAAMRAGTIKNMLVGPGKRRNDVSGVVIAVAVTMLFFFSSIQRIV